MASSPATVPNKFSRSRKSSRRSTKIWRLRKKNWLLKFKKMKWWTLKSLKLKKNIKRKKSSLRWRLMIYRRRYISLIRTFKKKKMSARRSKKSWSWPKSKMIFCNKIIRLLSRNIMKINKSGRSFLSVSAIKWRSTNMYTQANFQLIHLSGTISSKRVLFLLKSSRPARSRTRCNASSNHLIWRTYWINKRLKILIC